MKKVCSKCKKEKNIQNYSKNGFRKRSVCRVCDNKRNREYRLVPENKKKESKRKKLYNALPAQVEKRAQNYLKNKENKKIYNKFYREINREKLNKYKNQYIKEKYNTDINFKLIRNLRGRTNKAVRHNYKVGSAVTDLSCSIDEFKKYIESLFKDGMSWENYGKRGWHLDHIIPLSSFNLENREEFLKATHYTNYQPLWWFDNISKGAAIR